MSEQYLIPFLLLIGTAVVGTYIGYLQHLIRDAERERDEWRALALDTSRKMDESNLRWESEWSLMVPCVTALRGLVEAYEGGTTRVSAILEAKKALRLLQEHNQEAGHERVSA